MKNSLKTVSSLFIFGLGLFLTTSCKNKDPKPNNDAIKLALEDSRFTVFTKLLTDNGLVGTLNANVPYTIFAPINEAFSKIDLSKLTKVELSNLLNTHIVTERRLLTSEIKSGTVQSPNVEIYLSKNASGIFINGSSKIISPDILASNGVIHVIDQVVLPPTKNMLEIISNNPNLSELNSLVLAAGNDLVETLFTPKIFGFTVLAPTNAAFEAMYNTIPKATLLEDKKLLNEVLRLNMISRRILSTDFPNLVGPVNTNITPMDITTMPLIGAGTGPATNTGLTISNPNPFTGQFQVIFDVANGFKVRGVRSGSANITNVNLLAKNGVIHTTDKVLLPY